MDLTEHPEQAEDLLQSRVIALVPRIYITKNTSVSMVESLLVFIRDSVTLQLEELKIGDDVFNNIDPALVSAAVLNVQHSEIFGVQPGHYQAIFAGINNNPSNKLRHLFIWPAVGRVVPVDPDIVAGAAMRLETLDSLLSIPQVVAIFTRLADTEDSRLRKLAPGGNCDISSMDPEIVARALTKLETVGYRYDLTHSLSPSQVTALFSRIRYDPKMRITGLHLYRTDISWFPPETLIQTLHKVRKVSFIDTRMTAEQAIAILTMIKENRLGRLQTISIWIPDVEVPAALLQEARLNNALEFVWH